MSEVLIKKLEKMVSQFDEIEKQLGDTAVLMDPSRVRDLSVKRAAISDVVEQYRTFQKLNDRITENEEIIEQNSDPELMEIAREELPDLHKQREQWLQQIANRLATAADRHVGSVILEVRAGTGGAEAGLWAGDVFEMYRRYADRHRWQFKPLDFAPAEVGGVRQAIAHVKGSGVWQRLAHEGGVHSVKRVPITEAQGRIHTSTATVAVLPEPEKVEIDIPDDDVQIHVTTAQGPGGQNVNKVATAVHMIHKPTGIEVRMQTKSQAQNRAMAWQLLRARIFDHLQRKEDAKRAQARSSMIGSGDRSERIRTYRYKQNIVVDHRLGDSFGLQQVLAGDLNELIDALIAQERAKRLATG